MSKDSSNPQTKVDPEALIKSEPQPGPVSQWLSEQDLDHQVLGNDHLGIEAIGIEPKLLFLIASALKSNGFDYLECQGGYDEGPGQRLVCFYDLVAMDELIKDSSLIQDSQPRKVRLKVFLAREGNLQVPSLYSLYRGSDWQERETYDMFGITFEGHPHPKRLLMPEDWKGWPLRKDYVQPDFFEMQDAY